MTGTTSPPTPPVGARDRREILTAVGRGVVPATGFQHIQVGRQREIAAILEDIEVIADGGSAVRFIVGDYGSGKTFFLHLVGAAAVEQRLVTTSADLGPDRRLYGTDGQAKALYTELMRNASTQGDRSGGALASIVERFISAATDDASERGAKVPDVIQRKLGSLTELAHGHDFVHVVNEYWRGHVTNDTVLREQALRWLRGQFSSKLEARSALGVRTVIDDAAVYDAIKIFAQFCHQAGFGGLLVRLDELTNIFRLAHTPTRQANFSQILHIFNDLSGSGAPHLGFIFTGTPKLLFDERRGLYAEPSLKARLAPNVHAAGLIDLAGPLINLPALTREETLVLLEKLRHVSAGGNPSRYTIPDAGLIAFIARCEQRLGNASFATPRTIAQSFVQILSTLEQNPDVSWERLVGAVDVSPDAESETDESGDGFTAVAF